MCREHIQIPGVNYKMGHGKTINNELRLIELIVSMITNEYPIKESFGRT